METILTAPFTVLDGKVVVIGDGSDAPTPIAGGIDADNFAIINAFCDGYLWAGYLRDVGGIWWFHARNKKALFVTAEADGFRTFDDDYGVSASGVYLEDRLIPDADPASFALVANSTCFARDRSRLYAKDGAHFFHFDELDMDTLVANGPFVGDKDNLFHHGNALTIANNSKLHETVQYSLDDEHDMLLKDWFAKHHPNIIGWRHPDYPHKSDGVQQIAHDWFKAAEAVFHRESATTGRNEDDVFNLLRGANASSFEPLDAEHARDAAHIFCRRRRIAGADAASFKTLGGLFGCDKHPVYFNGYRVHGADPAQFRIFQTERPFGADARRVYATTFARTSAPFGHPDDILAPLDKADPQSFQPFGTRGAWAADADRVYLHGEYKKKLDAKSFRFLCETPTNGWAQDANGVYRSNGTMAVAGIDGSSFVKLNDFWGRDEKVVFSFVTGAIQKAIDAASFEIIDDEGGAKDAGGAYRIENGAIKKKKR